MSALLSVAVALAALQAAPMKPGQHDLVFQMADGRSILYGITVPRNYDPARPRPLVLALHPGGARMRYYGSAFVQQVIAPGLGDLQPVIVAPDCPTPNWTDPAADTAVMALLDSVFKTYAIDRRRVLVAGFSMGGRGTWFMASRHSDVFTAAIPMAASTGDEPADRLATMPTYIIHSRADQVVPFAPAERNAQTLEKMGRPVRFEAIRDAGHFEMSAYIDALRRAGRWISDRWGR